MGPQVEHHMSTTSGDVFATIVLSDRHQTIEGFGASIAWYDGWLTAHPNKDRIYEIIFTELGLSILRLRNSYESSPEFAPAAAEVYSEACRRMAAGPKVTISSWSPPPDLKSNASRKHGTLRKEGNAFLYDEYAQYWLDSLLAYGRLGIRADYVSIQNEPDFDADYDSCVFKPAEGDEFPSYGKALAAVYSKLQTLPMPPGLLGPETLGIGNRRVQEYLSGCDLTQLHGIAHHLYDGGSHEAPDGFVEAMRGLAEGARGKPLFMTEFGRGDYLQTAWLIHNALVEEGVCAYLYWDLVWNKGGLVTLENPWQPDTWKTSEGFAVNPNYYAFKHYCRFVRPGWRRVTVTSSNPEVRVSAFTSPTDANLTTVIVNPAATAMRLTLIVPGVRLSGGSLYQTTATKHCELTPWLPGAAIALPPRSITTLAAAIRPM
jgi:glucuronoarabinoxylan endo-1,4-beta-xylanase